MSYGRGHLMLPCMRGTSDCPPRPLLLLSGPRLIAGQQLGDVRRDPPRLVPCWKQSMDNGVFSRGEIGDHHEDFAHPGSSRGWRLHRKTR